MTDAEIITLYWKRDEQAIGETARKYGTYCHSIAYHILTNQEDAEECVNDTWSGAWKAMPPYRPDSLSAFLGKITRRVSLKLLRNQNRIKRGSSTYIQALEELEESIPSGSSVEDVIAEHELTRMLNIFLDGLPDSEQKVFVCRYWYLDSISDICKRFGYSESKVKSMLFRTRRKLHDCLRKEGVLE